MARVLDSVVSTDTARRDEAETDCMLAMEAAAAVARDMAGRLDQRQLLVSGPAYEEARGVWNGAVDHRPALIVRPWTSGDVQAAVRAAREHQLPLSVLGGGHDWADRAVPPGGLVIDLSQLRRVTVDARTRIATVAGGATAADVAGAAAARGLTAVVGMTGRVGMAGLTLAGGYGPLTGRFGLALDNLLGADVVLEDGRRVQVDATTEPELFWALRGGGGNFGVVTSMRIQLHPLEQVQAGVILFPWGEAVDVWSRLDCMLAGAPRELTVQSGILAGEGGDPLLYVFPAWSGDPVLGEKLIAALRRLGSPLACRVIPSTPVGMLGRASFHSARGRHYAVRTRNVASLTPDVILALVRAGAGMTSPFSGITVRHFHGHGTRIPAADTAFGIRREHFVVEVVAGWSPDDHDAVLHRTWADSLATALVPSALPCAFPGLRGPADGDQIAHAHGDNTARLLAAMRHYAPDGIFSARPVPNSPARSGDKRPDSLKPG
jgi:FAD binding domain